MTEDMSDSDNERTRGHPRYRAALPVNVNGISLHTTNVSLSGMQLSCPNLMLHMIGDDLEGNTIRITLTLAGNSEVTAGCEVVYVSDHDEEYLIGLHISGFEGAGENAYGEYIEGLSQRLPQ